ncbi:hypothetical protein ACFL2H_07525 [Planctomycetota bacterium]
MGRYCKVCGNDRPNEAFGGKGLRSVICNRCRRLPKEQRNRALWLDEVLGFLEQSNISPKNIERLRMFEKCEIDDVVQLAVFVRQVAEVKPRKKKRWQWIREKQPDLFTQAVDLGLCEEREDEIPGEDLRLSFVTKILNERTMF